MTMPSVPCDRMKRRNLRRNSVQRSAVANLILKTQHGVHLPAAGGAPQTPTPTTIPASAAQALRSEEEGLGGLVVARVVELGTRPATMSGFQRSLGITLDHIYIENMDFRSWLRHTSIRYAVVADHIEKLDGDKRKGGCQ